MNYVLTVYEVGATVVLQNGDKKKRQFIGKMVVVDGTSDRDEFLRISYANERLFYSQGAAALLSEGGVCTVPKVLHMESDDLSTVLLMNDLRSRFPIHPEVLHMDQVSFMIELL